MNGSGIVALDLNDGNAGFALYSQHHDGEIRKYEFLDDSWTGGFGDDVVVSSNARNGTPLMALSYVIRDELIWRLFYVDVNDTLQEKINSNKTRSGWTDGLLGNGGFKVSSSPQVGLSACRNYRWYGAPYNISDFGIRLYYGGDDHAIHELLWSYGNQAWDTGTVFDDSNGDGGVECTAGPSQPPGITNLWLLNSKGELEQRWYDFNDTSRSPDHLTSTWVKGFTYPHVRKNSAITAITSIGPGQPKLVHFQLANNTVRQLVTTGVAETSEWTEYLDIEERPAIPNSRLGSVVLSTDRGGGKVHVFCQTNGTDITDFIRTLVSDNWFIQSVPTGPA
ncbi:MAG: hypothetical protein M1837_004926 [Sclerophora amabilis]|nr:MAG: hypothetical protein M1837_004926 [Sclerophora amabilis]